MTAHDIFGRWVYQAELGQIAPAAAESSGGIVVYVHKGRCRYADGKERGELEAGAVLLAPGRGFLLTAAVETPCLVTELRFDPHLLQPLLQPFAPVCALQPFEDQAVWRQPLAEAEQAEMEELLARIGRFYGIADPLPQGRLRAAAADLLLFLYGQWQAHLAERPKPPTEKEKVIREIISFIESRYMDDLSMEQLEAHIHLSKYYMMKLFKELTGMTIFHYLNHFRINQAKVSIYVNKELSITEVGYQVGFKQPSHFSRNFKEIVGLSPEQYRRMV